MYALQGLLQESGANTSLTWLLLVALAFFVLMVVVGWLTSKNKESMSEVAHEAHEEHAAPAAESKSADDLTKLEGIGPKVAKVLSDIGIVSFADLAGADATKVQETLNASGMQYMNPEGWIEQAKILAAGGETDFSRRSDAGAT